MARGQRARSVDASSEHQVGQARVGPARRVPEGAPAIAPALRDDWATSGDVLVPIYEILGPRVGLDPCSNGDSIVEAETKIVLPPGKTNVDIVGGLAESWFPHKTFFCNPPFGDGIINLWVKKAIQEAMLGAEGIMLLPAYVSAHFFADIWSAAQLICFWGIPGVTNSRVKFIGAKDSATFPIMLVYFGPNVEHAARVLSLVGQCIAPSVMQSWLRMARGDVLPSLRDGFDDSGFSDPIYVAMRRACRHQYDDFIAASTAIEAKTVAELVSEEHPLLDRILELTVGEIAGGLSALQRVEPMTRTMPTCRKPSRSGRRHAAAKADEAGQLSLISVPAKQAAREELDRKILFELSKNYETGLLAIDLRDRVDTTPGNFRASIKRLSDRALVHKTGTTTDTRYFPARKSEKNHDHPK